MTQGEKVNRMYDAMFGINGKKGFIDEHREMYEEFIVKIAFKKRNKFMITVWGTLGGALIVAITELIRVLA